jgi:hypothetical protein
MKPFVRLVIAAVLGATLLAPVNMAASSTSVPNAAEPLKQTQSSWLDMRSNEGVVYFLFGSPARIERYDMEIEQWLSAVTFREIPTAMAVDSDGIYIAFGSRVKRYNLDGSGETSLVVLQHPVVDMQVAGPYLYLYWGFGWGNNGLVSIRKTSGIVIDTREYWYTMTGISIAPGIGRLYARSSSVSPSDIVAVTLNPDGTLGNQIDSPYHGDYPDATRTFVFPGEARVADDSGVVYATNDLRYNNSLAGPFADLTFYGDLPIVLRNNAIISYSNAFHETGRYTPAIAPLRLQVHGESVYAFSVDSGGVQVEKIAVALLQPDPPGQPVDPNGLAYTPDGIALGQDQTLYILSKGNLSVFRWSVVQRRYLETIPLADVPRYMAYSGDTNRLYLAYPSGKLTQIMLDTSVMEQPFANLPQSPCGLATAGQFVFACDPSGAWVSHYTFGPDGILISQKDWNYYSHEYVWSSANQKIYFFSDDTSPNDLFWQEIRSDGTIGTMQDSPYHGGIDTIHPIRVAPDGSTVILGSGSRHDAISLVKTGNLPNQIVDGTWSTGQFFSLRGVLNLTQIQKWNTSYSLVDTRQFVGTPIRLFAIPEGMLVVASYLGHPRFSIWDRDLAEIFHLPIADFSALPTTGPAPLPVAFTNQSMGGTHSASLWDFGDGATSNDENPNHTYAAPGTYTVALTVTGQSGSDTVIKEQVVQVLYPFYLPLVLKR